MNSEDYKHFQIRLGEEALRKRLYVESVIIPKKFRNFTHNVLHLHEILEKLLKLLGMYEKGYQQYKDIQVTHNHLYLRNLPDSFIDKRILHLTDLHVDLVPGAMLDVLMKIIPNLDYDYCVLTGDYRNGEKKDNSEVIDEMTEIIKLIKSPILGILGNHDSIRMVEPLENAGLKLLLNESAQWSIGGERLDIIGIDDPEFFQSHDLEKACNGIAKDACALLLSHSPCIYREISTFPISGILSGHTHGGQICLPGGVPLITSSRAPRRFISGAWDAGGVSGYTSRGTGACKLPIRLNCPPEVAIHVLKQA